MHYIFSSEKDKDTHIPIPHEFSWYCGSYTTPTGMLCNKWSSFSEDVIGFESKDEVLETMKSLIEEERFVGIFSESSWDD